MNPGLEYYRPFGNQAYVIYTVLKVPLVGHTVTIQGTVFTFGTDFFGNTQAQVAENLCAAINGDRHRFGNGSAHLQPSRLFFAYYSGRSVIVLAAQPGTAGNAYTAATSDSSYISRNNATFQGGIDGSVSFTGTAGALPAAASLTKRTLATGTVMLAATGVAEPLVGSATKFTKLHIQTPSTNAATVTLGAAAAQALPLLADGWAVFDPPPGTCGDLNDVYVKGTAGDVVNFLYWN